METQGHSTNRAHSCQNCKIEFEITKDDMGFYERIKVPPPTFCPECRIIRRFAFRNQRNLFKASNFFNNQKIFSLIPSESETRIITQEEWFGDSWDAMDYGIDVDFSKPFLTQLFELHKNVPQQNLNVTNMINSPYSGNANDLKNCYMVFNASLDEDCMYGTGYYNSKNCINNCDIYNSEFCSNNFWLEKCSHVHFSQECVQCFNVWFSKNCIGCINCIGCVNLRNKSYYIFNIEYTKDEYEKEVKKLSLDTYEGVEYLRIKTKELFKKYPVRYIQGIKNVNSSGIYITNSKNTLDSYMINGGEDLKYSQYISQPKNRDCYDISVWGDGSELSYEYSSCGTGIYNSKFIIDCWPNIRNLEYSLHCNSSSDLFGCVGLKKKQYCILNKQYKKDEYDKLILKIKKHMNDMPYIDKQGIIYKYGEFFPIEFSWYGYNNTMAQEFFPINKDEGQKKGYQWYDAPKGEYEINFDSKDLPNTIKNVGDEVLQKVIKCGECGSAYKILSEELSFLKRENIPAPHKCPNCRYTEVISNRLGMKIYERSCMKEGCDSSFFTGYDPKEKNIVYCEKCYQQEVY